MGDHRAALFVSGWPDAAGNITLGIGSTAGKKFRKKMAERWLPRNFAIMRIFSRLLRTISNLLRRVTGLCGICMDTERYCARWHGASFPGFSHRFAAGRWPCRGHRFYPRFHCAYLADCSDGSPAAGMDNCCVTCRIVSAGSHFGGAVRYSLQVLAAVPSIVFGLFGNAFFSIYLGMGFSILSGGLTLACMLLPILVSTAESGLRAIPDAHRLSAAALGMSRTSTLFHLLLPIAAPLTGCGTAAGDWPRHCRNRGVIVYQRLC